ncbi:hypothetical protein EYF80_026536 [Liparis tanakae]|uniref:Uncharacterized protein n=1 Tax=Liparis tanakae TaxID=230148 RepID=A0A4Z2HDF0_9TELE|nr:hypothetical protein EYF80_026536 [Liparis tanakae]
MDAEDSSTESMEDMTAAATQPMPSTDDQEGVRGSHYSDDNRGDAHNENGPRCSKAGELRLSRGGCREDPLPLIIRGAEVGRADSYTFLGLQVTSDLSWTLHTTATAAQESWSEPPPSHPGLQRTGRESILLSAYQRTNRPGTTSHVKGLSSHAEPLTERYRNVVPASRPPVPLPRDGYTPPLLSAVTGSPSGTTHLRARRSARARDVKQRAYVERACCPSKRLLKVQSGPVRPAIHTVVTQASQVHIWDSCCCEFVEAVCVCVCVRVPGNDEGGAHAGLNTSPCTDSTWGLDARRRRPPQAADVGVDAHRTALPLASSRVHQHHNVPEVQPSIARQTLLIPACCTSVHWGKGGCSSVKLAEWLGVVERSSGPGTLGRGGRVEHRALPLERGC